MHSSKNFSGQDKKSINNLKRVALKRMVECIYLMKNDPPFDSNEIPVR